MSTLIQRGYFIQIFDPLVPTVKIHQDLDTALPDSLDLIRSCVKVCSNVYEACEGAHSAAILNGWDALRSGPLVVKEKEFAKVDEEGRTFGLGGHREGIICSRSNIC